MPQWRKLHVKATESLDIHEMPDDFTRLLWVMLPLALDQHGRGIDSTAWVKSKAMPLRNDIGNMAVETALAWYADRGMIERYRVNGRHYFWIPTWYSYQGNTNREADSIYPAPPSWVAPEWVQDDSGSAPDDPPSDSRPTQEPVASKSSSDADVDVEAAADADTEAAAAAPVFCSEHGKLMTLKSKDGDTWYSHKLADGTWCKGVPRGPPVADTADSQRYIGKYGDLIQH